MPDPEASTPPEEISTEARMLRCFGWTTEEIDGTIVIDGEDTGVQAKDFRLLYPPEIWQDSQDAMEYFLSLSPEERTPRQIAVMQRRVEGLRLLVRPRPTQAP